MRTIYVRALSIGALTALLALAGNAAAQTSPSAVLNALEVRKLIASSEPGDNARLSAHFAALAERYTGEAKRHTAMAHALVGNRNRSVGSGSSMHCTRLAELNTQSAATLRELAAGATPAAVAALPLRPFRGDLDWPVNGTVRRRFSRSSSSNGIEIAADEGADARAIHEGVVAFADTFAGFGNLVILEHGSQSFSLYGDLLEVAVRKGARLERGQRVGTVGPMPSGSAGLYFELRVDGQPVDPLQWLKKR